MHAADRLLDPADLDAIRRLEECLWRPETRFDNSVVEQAFAADFFEFGRSGRTYSRAEMLFDPAETQSFRATLPLPGFHARHLTDDVVQVTYVSEVTSPEGEISRANRSSIWSRTPDGWRLRFHQGTPVGTGTPPA